MSTPATDITQNLIAYGDGDQAALDVLLPEVYDELRRIAARYLARERPDHTLQPTALVHEAYLRLVDQHSVNWRNRAQFFGLAANMMRRILVNHAEARRAAKRGRGQSPVALEETIVSMDEFDLDVLALEEALKKLAAIDPGKASLVEMKFFAGMTIDEIAAAIGKSTPTIERDWAFARTWLYKTLTEQGAP
jgi:RNA polymerase sigma factor (TIGR02999 family)